MRAWAALVRGAFASLLLSSGVVLASACQVALRADGEDARCNLKDGTKCPGTELTCQNGRCLRCTPAEEVCNGIDDNCDGQIDEGFDRDGDGFTTCMGDCNDDPDTGGALVNPKVVESCNGNDDNCNSLTDENTCPGQDCWPDKKGCRGTGDCCTHKDDCRKNGTCPKGLGCNSATGYCDADDCTTKGCPLPGYDCDPSLRACIRRVKLGDVCNPPAEPCSEGVCVDAPSLGIPRAGRVCAVACCASEDCANGFVCKYAASGQSMCVRATDIGLPAGGAAVANSPCSTGASCRSGVCANAHCSDGCCGSETCGAGGTCSMKGDARILCRDAAGTAAEGSPCGTTSTACRSGLCVSYGGWTGSFCSKRCCTSFDCKSDERCVIQKLGEGSYMPICVLVSVGTALGAKKGGQACLGNGECRSGTCNDNRCSEICCHDSDCDPETVCRPSAAGPLRCLAK